MSAEGVQVLGHGTRRQVWTAVLVIAVVVVWAGVIRELVTGTPSRAEDVEPANVDPPDASASTAQAKAAGAQRRGMPSERPRWPATDADREALLALVSVGVMPRPPVDGVFSPCAFLPIAADGADSRPIEMPPSLTLGNLGRPFGGSTTFNFLFPDHVASAPHALWSLQVAGHSSWTQPLHELLTSQPGRRVVRATGKFAVDFRFTAKRVLLIDAMWGPAIVLVDLDRAIPLTVRNRALTMPVWYFIGPLLGMTSDRSLWADVPTADAPSWPQLPPDDPSRFTVPVFGALGVYRSSMASTVTVHSAEWGRTCLIGSSERDPRLHERPCPP